MRKKLIGLLFCVLMLVGTLFSLSTASCQQIPLNKGSTSPKESINWTTQIGFIRGDFISATWVGDRVILLARGQTPETVLTFVTPFRSHQLLYDEQIQLVNPKFCFFHQDFVIGFSKIYLPKCTVSMHIISQNDSENTVTWDVDSIEGGSVWKMNMRPDLYDQFGKNLSAIHGWWPISLKYLSVGDQFSVQSCTDGYYHMVLSDDVTGYVLYSSPLIKF